VPRAADVEVVGQVLGEHPAVAAGEDKLGFDRQQEPAPLSAPLGSVATNGVSGSVVVRRLIWA
jgi:hypothetical protein